eukprot:CAMPEP_0177733556 /NCGR_PEP_ID=MMETSP0484_2-20121128/23747_1 /TAXON_ID=354590 /ORGANISM="Rhodomonas lens, Strain RHODO" /LENGTH=395 /DNA_ID=CAMNT_0019246943 /DNA_START=339 /DNA_END=1523 /DNA_ORIENTATION=-
MEDSRSAAVEQWFLGLQPEEREAVVTVRNEESASMLRKMLDVNCFLPASSSHVFYFVDALQSRRYSNYGSWFVGSRSPKLACNSPNAKSPRATDCLASHQGTCPPQRCQLAVRECPSHLAENKKVGDAAWRLEETLRLDFTETISVPWHAISDPSEARELFRSLMALAGPVKPQPARSEEQPTALQIPAVCEAGVCQHFSVASFAASLLVSRMLAVHRAAEHSRLSLCPSLMGGVPSRCPSSSSAAATASLSSSALEVDPQAFVVRLATLFRDCLSEKERTRWELEGVRALLRCQLDPKKANEQCELTAAAESAAKAKARGTGFDGRTVALPTTPEGGWSKVDAWAKAWSDWDPQLALAAMSAAPTPPESVSPPGEEEVAAVETAGHVLCEHVLA